ncbi:DUF222 domain-containing protein [Mycolicibacterium aurum]|uniref:DUF222 domain-containing protein n=1 Tax=Mycolicibacterium aurum TaxID=1791 RepID=UPI00065E6242|nr:DUF222 domain-containing protein [Mycolicibacterium aurum]
MFESMFDIDRDASQAELRALVERCERLKSAAAAAQARATALWAAKRRDAEQAAGVSARRRGKGLASEIALARRDAPVKGNQHLGFAQALVQEMPHTLAALECGALSEWRATLIVRESACLTVEHRRQLDAELCADTAKFDHWGNNRVEAEAKKIAARLDVAAVVEHNTKAEQDRCVTIRPAPNTMAYVSLLLPVAQAVSIYAALTRHADTIGDGRSRHQIMADTACERITGRAVTAPVSVALNLVMADTTLAGDDTEPAWLDGYGPVPAGFACKLTGDAVADAQAKATLRRLYRHPRSGQLVAMESRARIFPKGLARFIGLRDQTCRTPFGPTTALNGLGMCQACNYTKEAPDWTVTTTDHDGDHTAEFRTPTHAVYHSIAPPLPGTRIRRQLSLVEGQLGIDIITFEPRTAA